MGFLFWIILTVVFVILEIFIPALVTIWFGLAAFITIFIAFVFENLSIEIISFTLLSIFFIIFTRPYTKKILFKNKEEFNSSTLNSEVKIEKVVDVENDEKIYEVKFKGSIWIAISEDTFKENDKAFISKFKGNKIYIKRSY